MPNREEVGYQLWFIPEIGIEQAPSKIGEDLIGATAAATACKREFETMARDQSDWFEPANAHSYGAFVAQAYHTIGQFKLNRINGISIVVPYGTLVVCG